MICKHGTSGRHTITNRISATERAVDTPRATHSPHRRRRGSMRRRKQWPHIVPHVSRIVDQCDRESSGWPHLVPHTLRTIEEDRTAAVRRTSLQQREQGHTTLHNIDGGASLSPRSKSVVNSVSSRKPIQRSLRGASSQPA